MVILQEWFVFFIIYFFLVLIHIINMAGYQLTMKKWNWSEYQVEISMKQYQWNSSKTWFLIDKVSGSDASTSSISACSYSPWLLLQLSKFLFQNSFHISTAPYAYSEQPVAWKIPVPDAVFFLKLLIISVVYHSINF